MVAAAFIAAAVVGTLARVFVSLGLNRDSFPFGTLAVNVTGAFLLGLLQGVSPDTLTIFGTGALGSFTTFSTLTHESLRLCHHRLFARGALYLAGTVAIGVAAAWGGMSIAE